MKRRTLLAGMASATALALTGVKRADAVVGDSDITITRSDIDGHYQVYGRFGQFMFERTDARTAIMDALTPLKMDTPTPGTPSTIINRIIKLEANGSKWGAWSLDADLLLPPMQNCEFDARSVTFIGGAIVLDSSMDTDYYFTVLAGGLRVAPRTPGPDAHIGIGPVFIDSAVSATSVVGSLDAYAPGSVAVLFDAYRGPIQRSELRFLNVHNAERLIYSPNPGPGMIFIENTITARALYQAAIAVQAGFPGAGGHWLNEYNLTISGDITQTGVAIYGDRETLNVRGTGGVPANRGVVFEDGAERNILTYPGGAGYVTQGHASNLVTVT